LGTFAAFLTFESLGAFELKYKYKLPNHWIDKVANMVEFANGATKISVRLISGKIICDVLISAATYIVAARGFGDLPFAIDDIADIFQSEDDRYPRERGSWDYWDDWTSK